MSFNLESKDLVDFVRSIYGTNSPIVLHEPTLVGNTSAYVGDTVSSTFVSSVGKYVDKFESQIKSYTQAGFAVATVNGTAALGTILHALGVGRGDHVITQSLNFVASSSSLVHLGAEPIFLDVSFKSLGLCPIALEGYLVERAYLDGGRCINKSTGRPIKCVLPMHTFGHPAELDEIKKICREWCLLLVEDAAESLGSLYKGQHTGTFGDYSILSFNGNKLLTTGGGGMILGRDANDAVRIKHLTTTAKKSHAYEYFHDEPGFNYRLPNINAALGCGQLEYIDLLIQEKRKLAAAYEEFFESSDFEFVREPDYARSNYWLNAIICQDKASRDELLESSNKEMVHTRPIWQLMHRLPFLQECITDNLEVSGLLADRVVNLPSSPPSRDFKLLVNERLSEGRATSPRTAIS